MHMAYINTFNREQEIEILTRYSEIVSTITKRRISLARARLELKKAMDAQARLKEELYVCRYGADNLAMRRTNMAKARDILTSVRAKAKPVVPPTPAAVVEAAPVVSTAPPTPESLMEFRCPQCNTAPTPRGMCKCPGVRHRAVRKIEKAPNISINHEPVKPFDMGTFKE